MQLVEVPVKGKRDRRQVEDSREENKLAGKHKRRHEQAAAKESINLP